MLSSGRPSARISLAAMQQRCATYTRPRLLCSQPRSWVIQAACAQHARGSRELLRSRRGSVNSRGTPLVCSAAASWAIADSADANRLPLMPDSVEVRDRPIGYCCGRSRVRLSRGRVRTSIRAAMHRQTAACWREMRRPMLAVTYDI